MPNVYKPPPPAEVSHTAVQAHAWHP
jgi:hypothetical protein